MKASVQTNFKNERKASYVARNIASWHNRGTAIEAKIETVLNQLREYTGIRSLKELNNTIVQAYLDTLQDRLQNDEITPKTAASYVSALNDIIRYTSEHLPVNLNPVSAKENGLSVGHVDYINRSVDSSIYKDFVSHLEAKQDIKSQALARSVELQRQFGLRLRESIAIKRNTIREALKTGKLHLTKHDLTKNGRERIIPIRNSEQFRVLKDVYNFMRENHLKSLAPTQTLKEQYNFAQRERYEYMKNTKTHFRFHGFRHSFAHDLKNEGHSDKEIAEQLGHGRLERTYTA